MRVKHDLQKSSAENLKSIIAKFAAFKAWFFAKICIRRPVEGLKWLMIPTVGALVMSRISKTPLNWAIFRVKKEF